MTKNDEKTYKIQKPSAKNSQNDFAKIQELIKNEKSQRALVKATDAYLPWDEFRNKSWVPADHEHHWSLLKSIRLFARRRLPIKDKDNNYYAYDPQRHAQFLHEVDLELGGNMMGVADFSEVDKRQIIRRNLIEESISSSKLEGANTSREAARRMLQEGRKPNDKGERMIVNNHEAMQRIEETAKDQPMSLDLLLSLHRQVTSGTLSDLSLEGKIRDTLDAKGERLKIFPWDETTVAYVAPDKDFVEEQLPIFISFANDEIKTEFIHPLFKAIILHFWIGLLHPFEDGNGRLARIIFYWYMLRKGYWAFSYLSLSERILKSPKQYAMAYINTEQDDYDLNYFIQYNIEKLKLARVQFREYLKRKIAENRQQNRIIQGGHGLNARQIKLLQYLSKDEQRSTSVAIYNEINKEIRYVSAVADLKKLVDKGFLKKHKTGRNVHYLPTTLIRKIFQ